MWKKIRLYLLELKSIFIFYKKLTKQERDIVFYSEDTTSYRYLEGLVNHLTQKDDLKICYITSEDSDPLLRQDRKNIRCLYIKSLLPFFAVTLDCKLLIMTLPDLNLYRVKRSSFNTHYVYLFHNVGSSFPVIGHGALFHYDTIFCAGPHHIEEIRRQEEIYDLPQKNLVEYGYYSLEKIYDDYKKRSSSVPGKYKARILLAPSWGDESILDLCGEELIGAVLKAGYEVIVRPHPMTRIHRAELLENLNKKFENYDNYIYEGDTSSTDSFYNSDMLISDWSGVSYEYAFGTERPVLFIDVPRKVVNEKHQEVGIEPIDVGIRDRLGTVLGTDEFEKVDSVITDMLANKGSYVQEIIKARNEFVYNFGDSSRVGAEFVRNYLKEGVDEDG